MSVSPVQRVRDALHALDLTVKGAGPGRHIARCPAHDDRTPSLSIAEGRDGRALIYCHAGCPLDDVLAALGLDRRDLFDLSHVQRAARFGRLPERRRHGR